MVRIAEDRHELGFELSDGSEWSIPLPDSLPVAEALEMNAAFNAANGDGTKLTQAFMAFLDKHAPGLTELLTLGEMTSIFRAWGEAQSQVMGVTLGES